jgi:hypothetical protein
MSGKKAFIWSTTAAPVVLGVASGALAGSEGWPRGGFVKPCSLDGVNRFISPKVLATPRSPDDTGLSDGGMGFGGL